MTINRVSSMATCAAIILLTGLAPMASAQWTVTNLHPAGATGSSQAIAIDGNTQVGKVDDHAALWTGTVASWIDLNPAGATTSAATGVSGTRQAGHTGIRGEQRAALWSGSAAGHVSLHPTGALESRCTDIEGDQQVGSVTFDFGSYISEHAGFWTGGAGSFVDLHPSSSESSVCLGVARGIGGDLQQVGSATMGSWEPGFNGGGGLWHSTTGSWVELVFGVCADTDGLQQVGSAAIPIPFTFGYINWHAMLWSGTSASAVDLHPDGRIDSWADAVHGGLQVGWVGDWGGDASHASLWKGTAESWFDLHTLLPARFASSSATGIWTDGSTIRVVGWASESVSGWGADKEAILWTFTDSCYADCDKSTGNGVLDIHDFLCFQNSFVNGETYACDCDTSTGPLVCDVFDFLCFQNNFVNGCP